MRLLVNVDHVATLRNARGQGVPDPVRAARVCEDAGASGVVFHLREDRRHIHDEDVYRLKKAVKGTLDFEMAATDEMLRISQEVQPHLVTLVPESRQELTTEGGLRMNKVFDDFKKRVVPHYKGTGIEISLFIDPEADDIEQSAELGVEAIELHTGPYANAKSGEDQKKELKRLKRAAEQARELGLKVNAGHGLDFENTEPLIRAIPFLNDVSIGHALMCDALFNGLSNTVQRMVDLIES